MGKASKKERSALIYEAAETNKSSHLEVFLKEDTNIRFLKFAEQQEPLHVAANAGSADSVETLLNWGADPNSSDANGRTPLHLATANGYLEVTRLLIDHGAEPWLTDNSNNNALHTAMEGAAKKPAQAQQLIQLLMTYKKYDAYTFEKLVGTKNIRDLLPINYGIDLKISKEVIQYLSSVEPPKEEHVITILLHGWNDNISDWKIIERNFEMELQQMTYLFAYNSLANRVSIATLASDLRAFINEKRDFYITQKNKVSFQQFATSGDNKLVVKVNIICYSTGGLIVRTFLNKWYLTEYRGIIERVVMVAPANFGSPFAKFGKSSVGRVYVGQKKVGSLFECGEELLTSLEPSSPFIWDLAHEDALCPIEKQHFLPNKIMATIIQGTQHYEKNLQSKVTRGDMKGTDGTVTISGASMRCVKYSMNLSGGSATETAIIQRSTGQVAARLHPSHTHRSITTSLVEMTDVFSVVKRALEATKEQFFQMEKSFSNQNQVVYSKVHTPGNLLVFQYEGNLKPSIVPVLLYHRKDLKLEVGQAIDPKHMQTENRGNIVGSIRSQFSYTEYHSRSRNMFYKIVDFAMVSKIMISITTDLPGCAVSLAIALKGHAQQGRIIASTSWLDSTGDCFLTSDLSTTHLFCISPLPSESEKTAVVSSPSNSLQSLEADEDIDDTIRQMRTFGVLAVCKTIYENNNLESFVQAICKKRAEDLSALARVFVICALVPFFESCTVAQEGAAYLIYSASQQMLITLKGEIDSEQSTTAVTSCFSDLPSTTECTSLYNLVKLFKVVPVKFFKGLEDATITRYTADKGTTKVIHLSKLVADHIYNTSVAFSKVGKYKRTKKIICGETAIISRKSELYSDQIAYPGGVEFICRLCDNLDNSVIILRPANSKIPLPISLTVEELEYEEENVEYLQEAVDDYIRLFPEYDFYFVFPNTPVFKEVAKIEKRMSKDIEIFIKMPDEAANHHSTENFGTFVYASCLAFDRRLIDSAGVLAVAKKSVEDLQVLLLRKQALHPPVRWSHLAADIRAATSRVTVMNQQNPLSQWHLHQLDDLHHVCKQNQASIWLSDEGVNMILQFRDWVVREASPTSPQRNLPIDQQNPLIALCKGDSTQFGKFRKLLIEDVATTNPSRSTNQPLNPTRSTGRARSLRDKSPAIIQPISKPPSRHTLSRDNVTAPRGKAPIRARGISPRVAPGVPISPRAAPGVPTPTSLKSPRVPPPVPMKSKTSTGLTPPPERPKPNQPLRNSQPLPKGAKRPLPPTRPSS